MRRAVNLSAGLIPILHAECTSPVCAERSSAAQHCGSVGNGNFPSVFAQIVLIQGTDWIGSGTVTERRFFIYISVLSLMHVPSMCSEAEISRRSKECIPVLTVFLHLVQKWPSTGRCRNLAFMNLLGRSHVPASKCSTLFWGGQKRFRIPPGVHYFRAFCIKLVHCLKAYRNGASKPRPYALFARPKAGTMFEVHHSDSVINQ